MALITQAEALLILPLSTMKDELRIPVDILEHDDLLARQITDATNFIATATGVVLADLPALRPAIVAAVRAQYDGEREITPNAAHNSWLDIYRSLAG